MLGVPAYVDSSTLADLRVVLRSGVGKSEMLVVVLSKSLLTRSVHRVSHANLCCAAEALAFES
jgi:hypothetical protein